MSTNSQRSPRTPVGPFHQATAHLWDMMSTCPNAPFPPSCALNRDCLAIPDADVHSNSFQSENEATNIQYLPGNPAVSLLPDEVLSHLADELGTPFLDELYNRLRLVGRKSVICSRDRPLCRSHHAGWVESRSESTLVQGVYSLSGYLSR